MKNTLEKYCCIYNLLNIYILKYSFKQSLAKIYLQIPSPWLLNIWIPVVLNQGWLFLPLSSGEFWQQLDILFTFRTGLGATGVTWHRSGTLLDMHRTAPITRNYSVKMSIPPILRKPESNQANAGTSTNPKLRHLPIQ